MMRGNLPSKFQVMDHARRSNFLAIKFVPVGLVLEPLTYVANKNMIYLGPSGDRHSTAYYTYLVLCELKERKYPAYLGGGRKGRSDDIEASAVQRHV